MPPRWILSSPFSFFAGEGGFAQALAVCLINYRRSAGGGEYVRRAVVAVFIVVFFDLVIIVHSEFFGEAS